jgi:hypothetical protein
MQHLLSAAENSQGSAPPAFRVAPFIPILYFGNMDAFENSDLRIITVALNPSDAEFPLSSQLSRFPRLDSYMTSQQKVRRLNELQTAYNSYFEIDPYMRWFGHLEQVLKGFGASYKIGVSRTALHTDLMSPVATKPTWSKLPLSVQSALSASGVPLWHGLITLLRPDILLVSVARKNFERISFHALGHTAQSIVFGKKTRYPVMARTVMLPCGKLTDIIYTTPAQVPFGFLSHPEKNKVGPRMRGKLANW